MHGGFTKKANLNISKLWVAATLQQIKTLLLYTNKTRFPKPRTLAI